MSFTLPYTFLTTKPATRWLSTEHPEQLYVLPNVDNLLPSLVANILYKDGTTSEEVLIPVGDWTLKAGQARAFEVGYARWNYANLDPTKTIRSITISIYTSGAAIAGADAITYIPYTPAGDELKVIYYHNSYGGVDSLICAGDSQRSFTTDGLQVARPVELVYEGEDQYRMVQQRMRTDHSVNSGHKPRKEHQALIDLFLISTAYEYERISDDAYHLRPIILESAERALASIKTNIKNISFNYRYAFTQRAISRVI